MPRIADENRAYVMRYPHKVGEMLQKAWKLRKKIRQRQKEAGTAKRKKTRTSDAPERKEQQETGRRSAEELVAMRREAEGTMLPSERRDASVSEDTPPDWGGDDDDNDSNTEVELPAEWKAEDVTEDQWPWGPAGRPSDRGESAGHKDATTIAQPAGGTKAK